MTKPSSTRPIALGLLLIFVALPLASAQGTTADLVVKEFSLDVRVDNEVAVTSMSMLVRNPATSREIVLDLPLSTNAVLTNVSLITHNRTLYGIVWQKNAAQANYDASKAAGQDAVLIQSAGGGRLRISLNVPTETTVRLNATYAELLPLRENVLSYRFPFSGFAMAQSVERLQIMATVTSTIGWTGITSTAYGQPTPASNRSASFTHTSTSTPLATDWGLDIRPDASDYRSGAILSRRNGNLTLLANLVPPATGTSLPLDVVFVLDRSGSMGGQKILQARDAMHTILGQLRAEDRFGLVTFSDSVLSLKDTLDAANTANKGAAQTWVQQTEAQGSTDIEAGLARAFTILGTQESSAVPTVVLITDGLPTSGITDHGDIFRAVDSKNTLGARLHVVGIGFDQDNDFLAGLASAHRGFYEAISQDDEVEARLGDFYERIRVPVLRDLTVEFVGLDVKDMHPQPLPDLYRGSSLIVAGRVNVTQLPASVTVRITGRDAAGQRIISMPLSLADAPVRAESDRLWARLKANSLEEGIEFSDDAAQRSNLRGELLILGLRYQIATQETAWLITDSAQAQQYAQSASSAQLDSSGGGAGAPALRSTSSAGAGATRGTATAGATTGGVGGLTDNLGATSALPDADATPVTKTPGFEWIALLAAGLVAFAVSRRRR